MTISTIASFQAILTSIYSLNKKIYYYKFGLVGSKSKLLFLIFDIISNEVEIPELTSYLNQTINRKFVFQMTSMIYVFTKYIPKSKK